MKILNLYSGIGGNRKLWTDCEVTAVEINPDIAKLYQDFFPDDKVIIGDAHQYLLDNYDKGFDFIWSSPPCPTHSRFNFLNEVQNKDIKYADMTLYQEIILLENWFKGKYCIENVISYYEPLIKPQESNNHYFWCNFIIPKIKSETRGIRRGDKNTTGIEAIEKRQKILGINLDKYKLNNIFKKKILNNCTEPKLALNILNAAVRQSQMVMI